MKSSKVVFVLSLVAILTSSCYKRSGWGLRGEGSSVSETRPVEVFERIRLSVSADVEYTQDSIFRLEIIGQQNILAALETEVEGNELRIGFQRNTWDYRRLKIIVHSPTMRGFNISGSGDIYVQNSLVSNDFDSKISGSGNIYIPELNCERISLAISGSGNINIPKGNTVSEDFTISGSGNIDTDFFVCSRSTVKISGSGNMRVNVLDEFSVTISGSGDVKYRGQPKITSKISGSGSLINLN